MYLKFFPEWFSISIIDSLLSSKRLFFSSSRSQRIKKFCFLFIMFVWLMILVKLMTITFYPLANEGVKGYSNATVRPSFRPSVTILVNTLGSTSFNGF